MNWTHFTDASIMSVIGYTIVFICLAFLWFIFSMIPIIIKFFTNSKTQKTNPQKTVQANDEDMQADVVAAISTAIFFYLNEQHDDETYNLTNKKNTKRYSPWNSKIYAMNNLNKIH